MLQGIDDIGTSIASGASTGLGGPAISAAEGASLGKITGPLGGITSGVGLVTGLMQAFDPESSTGERVQGGLSATSGGLGVLGSFFPGFAAGGSAGLAAPVGTAFGAGGAAGVGTALGSAGAVLGAGLAGWGAGRGLDNLVDWIGDEVSGDEQADHSISGGLADVMTSVDQIVSSLWADESKPAYTQTLGWKLAEILPSWMQ